MPARSRSTTCPSRWSTFRSISRRRAPDRADEHGYPRRGRRGQRRPGDSRCDQTGRARPAARRCRADFDEAGARPQSRAAGGMAGVQLRACWRCSLPRSASTASSRTTLPGGRRRFGVRMALGARRIVVMRSVLGHSGRLTVTGLAIGLLGAAAGSRSLSDFSTASRRRIRSCSQPRGGGVHRCDHRGRVSPRPARHPVDPLIALARSRVLRGSTRFYKVLQGSTGVLRVLGFSEVLRGSSGSAGAANRVELGRTGRTLQNPVEPGRTVQNLAEPVEPCRTC